MNLHTNQFLAHYGVQGMKWGVRRATNKANVASLREKGLTKRQAENTNRAQNNIDKQRMTAAGRQGKVSLLKQARNRVASNGMLGVTTILRHPLSSKKAAVRQLRKNKEMQVKVMAGEKRVTAALLKLNGVKIEELNFDL